jgi:hypothetical protein
VDYADELMDIDGEDSGTKVTRANYLRIVLGGSDQGVMMLACKALGMGPFHCLVSHGCHFSIVLAALTTASRCLSDNQRGSTALLAMFFFFSLVAGNLFINHAHENLRWPAGDKCVGPAWLRV